MKIKKFLTIILFLFILISILFIYLKSSSNKTETSDQIITPKLSPIFVEKIVLFSSASTLNDYSNPWWNLNVYQYSDIAIYLSPSEDIKTATSIIIDNFKFLDGPNLGTPICSYISPLNLGKSDFDINSASLEKIIFDIKNISKEENFETPTFFNNFSSPLTFRYINKNIVNDFLLQPEESSSLIFDGTLLKKCSIKKEDISCKISFDITYIISDNESYKYNLVFDILLENNEQSIFEGNLLETIYPENITITQL